MSYCVGLTGGIASGKSTVARLFKNFNIDVIDADAISKALTQKGQPAYQNIIKHFGSRVLDENKHLARKTLRQIIFSNPKERTWLENLLHPLIRQEINQQVHQSQSAYCVIEIPLLVDKKNYPYLNRVLLIEAPESSQVERLNKRDQSHELEARAILEAQPNAALRRQHADDILINDGTLEDLSYKVANLHQRYLSFSLNKENSQSN